MNKKLFFTFFVLLAPFLGFAQRVISPVAGNFCNKQPLVIDTSDGAECFYSFSGSDPLASGFAYDGPVLIDSVGRTNLKITAVVGDTKEEIEINYNVQEINPFEQESAEYSFINEVSNLGVYVYDSSPLEIPSSLSYSMGDGDKPLLKGASLSIDPANSLSRYIPCNVTDGKNSWRFVILIAGGQLGTLSKYHVPFEISSWRIFRFTGKNLIWSIDDGDWSASSVPVELDRSVKHTVRWQSVAYKKGNPVQSFVIPAEPLLSVSYAESGAAVFSIDGDLRYRMEVISSGVSGQALSGGGLFTTAVFDTFSGDEISGEAVFAFYADGVYQGEKRAYFDVDKQPPLPPSFSPSSPGFFVRKEIELEIAGGSDEDVFFAASAPVRISEDAAASGLDYSFPEFDAVDTGSFVHYTGAVALESGEDSAVFYKVRAYCVDRSGNVGAVSEYRVVIDEFNYYMDSSASDSYISGDMPDGTFQSPFTSFDQALEVINSGRFAHFYVTGTFTLGKGDTVISSNCAFSGRKDASIIVHPEGCIVIQNSSLSAKNVVFQKNRESSSLSNSSFFRVENSTVSFDGCEIVGIFGDNGTGLFAVNSVLELENSGLTVQSDSYTCAASCVDSKLLAKGCRVSAVSQTAVDFSVSGGQFELRDSSCRVTAHLGRIAELVGTNARITGNAYTGEFDGRLRSVAPVWSDKDTLLLEDKDNSFEGF